MFRLFVYAYSDQQAGALLLEWVEGSNVLVHLNLFGKGYGSHVDGILDYYVG